MNKKLKTDQQNKNKLDKRLTTIKTELDIMKPETLLLNVDPSLETRETIESIQLYHSKIHSAMKHEDNEEGELEEEIRQLQQKVEEMVKPRQDDFIRAKEVGRSESPERRKPKIDFKSKIRKLKKEINLTNQNYMQVKSLNETKMEELDELRYKVRANKEKADDLKKELDQQETEYWDHKEEIEKKLRSREEKNLLKKIGDNQKILKKNNDTIIKRIKESDKDMTQKLAMKKYLDHEHKKLLEKEKKIIEKWKNEKKAFEEAHANEIRWYKSFDPSSKLLELINEEKMSQYEEMLSQIYAETNIDDISNLVQYFIKCTKEFKSFEQSYRVLELEVNKIDQEVDELEYIINFCEQNMEVEHVSEEICEEQSEVNEQEKVERSIRQTAEDFLHVQYKILSQLQAKFVSNLREQADLFDEIPFEEKDEFEDILHKVQLRIRQIITGMKNCNKKKNLQKDLKMKVDYGKIDNLYTQKAEKIREAVKKEFEKNGEKNQKTLTLKKIKGITAPLLNNG